MTPDTAELQGRTDAYFDRVAAYWRDVYADDGLQALIYRKRLRTVLGWVDELRLPPGSRVLEVGCGAGLATVELARRGYVVESTDSSAEMVELAAHQLAKAGLGGSVTVGLADVHALPHPSGSFTLALALGVLPWLHTPQGALDELARVLAPGGHLIVTADNRLRLNMIVEPVENPLVVPFKYARRLAKRLCGRRSPEHLSHLHTPSQVDRLLTAAGLEPVRRTTIGFGPFTVLGRAVLGDRFGLILHRRLERLAETAVPQLRRTAWHHIVAARKPSSDSL